MAVRAVVYFIGRLRMAVLQGQAFLAADFFGVIIQLRESPFCGII